MRNGSIALAFGVIGSLFVVHSLPVGAAPYGLAIWGHHRFWFGADVMGLMLTTGLATRLKTANWSKNLLKRWPREMDSHIVSRVRGQWHNPLTNLASRQMFEHRLATRTKRSEPSIILLVGLDKFKRINAQFGYECGDSLLQMVADRLCDMVVRPHFSDPAFVAHLCSDKFAILTPRLSTVEDAQVLGKEVLASFNAPFSQDGTTVRLSASVGVAEYPRHGIDITGVMQAATDALRIAKRQGRGVMRIYDDSMRDTEMGLRNALMDAIDTGEIVPFYQPIVDLGTGLVVGMEVLARWDHPSRGLLLPDMFIDLAEREGALRELTRWQLREVAHDSANWPEDLFFAFNIAPNQLPDIAAYTSSHDGMSDAVLAPHRIEVELTESARITDLAATCEMVRLLHSRGTRVALDDFGAGHGNFRHLCGIPFDRVKIDKEFVLNMLSDPRAELCVRSIIEAAERFGVAATAEGVASAEVAARVTDLGCRFGQGSLYAMPVRADAVPALLARLAAELPATIDSAPVLHSATGGSGRATAVADAGCADGDWRHADATQYPSKKATWGQFRLGAPALQNPIHAKRLLARDLRAALAARKFELHFVPKIDLRTARVVALRAQLRWLDPERGEVRRAVFMPLVEQMGLSGDFSSLELHQACQEAASWPAEVSVAVKVIAAQLLDGSLSVVVFSALTAAGLRPSRLELEIPNSTPVDFDSITLADLQVLRNAGVRITLDGFGAGNFALGSPIGFSVDKIKIDESLVGGLVGPHDGTSCASTLDVVRAIAGLCTSLDVICAADGVETERQYSTLASEACNEVEGGLFGSPIAARDVPGLLRRINHHDRIGGEPPAGVGAGAISFAQIAETASDIVVITGPNLAPQGPTILYVNPAFTRLTGYTAAEAVGRSPRFLQGPGTSRATLDTIGAALRAGRPVRERLLNYAKGGAPYWIDLRIVALRDQSNEITHFAAIERDVTLDQRRLDELEFAAERDPLTGILNRRALLRVVEAEMQLARSLDCPRGPCVAFIDVDHFKRVNDELGHATGDAVLYGMADRLADCIRRSDTLGRIGGEEFAVCLPGATLRDGEGVAEQLRRAVADAPFPTPNGPVSVTISIGVAAFAENDSLTELMQRADTAMYASKHDGRDRVTAAAAPRE